MEAVLTSIGTIDAKRSASRLLSSFRSVSSLLAANRNALLDATNGEVDTAERILSVRALMMFSLREQAFDGPVISSGDALINYLSADMAHLRVEQFRILFLNSANRLIFDEVLTEGTIDRTAIYPREVIRRALEVGAAGMILVHNHPSGNATPSAADANVTREICQAARLLGITVHDHLLIAQGSWTSMRELTLL